MANVFLFTKSMNIRFLASDHWFFMTLKIISANELMRGSENMNDINLSSWELETSMVVCTRKKLQYCGPRANQRQKLWPLDPKGLKTLVLVKKLCVASETNQSSHSSKPHHHSTNMELAKDLMAEFVFCEIDRSRRSKKDWVKRNY
uniref:Uncharacterized protein n=1 Tax=Timema bartmani TaxID=61472 RepID=A0A7R9F720_9NEOP|nr:unnamed protein product [Timema bartmani]